MAHEIASVMTCKLCFKKLAGPALIVGPGQSGRVGEFLQKVAAHIMQAHPQEYKYLEQKHLEFNGLQMLMQYTTNDPSLRFQRDWLRWQIHQQTLNARIPDEKIEEQSRQLAVSIVDAVLADFCDRARTHTAYESNSAKKYAAEKIAEVIRVLRDSLQEPTEPKLSTAQLV
jgi:hypothetical protein